MKRLLNAYFIILLTAVTAYSGFSFGMTSAVKKRVEILDEKVAEVKEKLAKHPKLSIEITDDGSSSQAFSLRSSKTLSTSPVELKVCLSSFTLTRVEILSGGECNGTNTVDINSVIITTDVVKALAEKRVFDVSGGVETLAEDLDLPFGTYIYEADFVYVEYGYNDPTVGVSTPTVRYRFYVTDDGEYSRGDILCDVGSSTGPFKRFYMYRSSGTATPDFYPIFSTYTLTEIEPEKYQGGTNNAAGIIANIGRQRIEGTPYIPERFKCYEAYQSSGTWKYEPFEIKRPTANNPDDPTDIPPAPDIALRVSCHRYQSPVIWHGAYDSSGLNIVTYGFPTIGNLTYSWSGVPDSRPSWIGLVEIGHTLPFTFGAEEIHDD